MLKVGFRLPEPWNHVPQDIAGHCGNDVNQKHQKLVLSRSGSASSFQLEEESHEDDAKDEGKGREGGLLKPLFNTS
jgi:hypothetical protein